jgi:hypothetical protein
MDSFVDKEESLFSSCTIGNKDRKRMRTIAIEVQ